jgi:hypothetical protein
MIRRGYNQPRKLYEGSWDGVVSPPINIKVFLNTMVGGYKIFLLGWMGVSIESIHPWKKRFGLYYKTPVTLGIGWVGLVNYSSPRYRLLNKFKYMIYDR